ncbi:MAG: glycosyltransferase family 2 protein [Methanomassiliicoccales archaeon]
MEGSVIIRCKDDWRVLKCIDSLDEDVETIVALVHNEDLESELRGRDIRFVNCRPGNLSVTSNLGISNASCSKVIITDSDTTFEPGCLKAMFSLLDERPVVRASMRFNRSPHVPFSEMLAEARDYVNALPLAFTPGLGLRKDMIDKVGGFAFNEQVPFAVDADLNYRIKAAGIDIGFVRESVIHDIEHVSHDLRAASRIGKGCAISSFSLAHRLGWQIRPHSIGKELKAVRPENWREIASDRGFVVLAYQLIWDWGFWSGYIRQSITNKIRPGSFDINSEQTPRPFLER